MATLSYKDPAYHNLIQFVPQHSKDNFLLSDRRTRGFLHTSSSNNGNHGDDIKHFYESLVNEDFSSGVISLANTSQSHSRSTVSSSQRKRRASKANSVSKAAKTKFSAADQHSDTCTQNRKLSEVVNEMPKLTPFISGKPSAQQQPSYTQRMYSKLMQSAQNGDLNQVSKLLNSGLDVNHTDFYGWTPLMCAAKEGHIEIVTFLLERCADHALCNSGGQTALTLAHSSGHEKCAQEITNFLSLKSVSSANKEEQTTPETYFCHICKSEFSSNEQSNHETSVVHLLSCGHAQKMPTYFIPENNRGFQMLLRSGWEVHKGLGRDGEGTKYPIKTVLKQDRKGLGGDSDKKAKVTHFVSNDKEAIRGQKEIPQRKMTARKAAKYEAVARVRREKKWEHDLRFELSGGFD